MTTRTRLEMFLKLPAHERADFIEANKDDKRFVSLIELREEFLTGFEKALKERI